MVSRTLETTDTRQRLIEVAIDLFTQHSFAGTSLQMIADELGFTKAAIYHHFRTREQLLDAVVEPIFDELATSSRRPKHNAHVHARAEHMLSGYAALAVQNRAVVAVLAGRPERGHDAALQARMGRPDRAPAGAARRRRTRTGRAGEGGHGAGRASPGRSGPTRVNLDEESLEHLVELAVAHWAARPRAWRKCHHQRLNISDAGTREGTAMKTAVVTGGGSGIGQAVAERLGPTATTSPPST